MTSRLDTLVIGAGAAGLACARRLFDAGQTVRVLEARDRIGGRIHTDTTFTGYPLELGAEFIHGERAVTHDLLRAAGLSVIPVDRLGAGLRWGSPAVPLNQIAPETRSTIEQLRAAYAALVGRDPALPDRALADYLRECGFAPGALRIADVLLAQTCCAPLDDLSCADLARELRVDHAGPLEFRIAEGYAPLLNWLACDLPLTLGSPVSQIHWGAHGVTVEANGAEFTAHRAVITLPVAVLASGAVTFDPPLPRLKQDALAALPTEPATKLIYRFAERRWDTDLTFMAHEGIAARWWTPGYRRAGPPVLAAYVTAGRARQVDALPEAEALALGLRDAAALLGQPELASLVTGARRVSWAADPWARGGYAHVRSGGAEARPALAMPLEGSLFFAGEATAHDSNPQTVHGAIESGWRAAREILAG